MLHSAKQNAVRRRLCPAKVNLLLCVTGRRPDGFHDLVSLVAPVGLADELELAWRDDGAAGGVALEGADPALGPADDNLVVRAARAYAVVHPWRGTAVFRLAKRIPWGAGLGGGSSDAAGALRLLAEALPGGPQAEALEPLAASVGSDCPLFLRDGPVVIRGRGERVAGVPEAFRAALAGRPVALFKPPFGVATPWAYAALAKAAPASYTPAAEAERRLGALLAAGAAWPTEACNSFEEPVFAKHLALPALLRELATVPGVSARMSGSGSCCWAVADIAETLDAVVARAHAAWGPGTFGVRTHFA